MKSIPPQKHKENVRRMFDEISPRYDRLNRILSLGTDRRWRKKMIRQLSKNNPLSILDLATGTADVAIAAAQALPQSMITAADISTGMLAQAEEKVETAGLKNRIRLMEGDAEHLNIESAAVDAVTIAFGVRNFENLDRGLREMHRVLRPLGKAYILEFSKPQSRISRAFYMFYLRSILPLAGRIFSGHSYAYTYLRDTIDTFPYGKEMCKRIVSAGFTACETHRLSAGIATLYIASA